MRGEHPASARGGQGTIGSAPRARGTLRRPVDFGNRRGDQPRVRGEHAAVGAGACPADGSAPRARGTRAASAGSLTLPRISPACAGNTSSIVFLRRQWPDQPRVRGEHQRRRKPSPTLAGSAPRARGTLGGRRILVQKGRISPACAGNTHVDERDKLRLADQPRVRGEHGEFLLLPEWEAGSAPRARGTHDPRGERGRPGRISPACAGNTGPGARTRCCAADQPRVRGEHRSWSWVRQPSSGSAPRARGTPRDGQNAPSADRISPACAGNTTDMPGTAAETTDQPRVRGEHHGPQNAGRVGERISPACAGNTRSLMLKLLANTDQPRVRGEHSSRSILLLNSFFDVKERTGFLWPVGCSR